MSTDQFSLTWDNFHNNLSTEFKALFKHGDLVDVTLSAEGHNIKAHKIVLSVCSPYFKDLLCSNPCEHPIIILHEVSFSALMNLLEFIYNGEVNVLQEDIPSFLRIAKALKVKGLTEKNPLEYNVDSNDSINSKSRHTTETASHAVKRPYPRNESTHNLEATEISPLCALSSDLPSSPLPKLPRVNKTESPLEHRSFELVDLKEEPHDYGDPSNVDDYCDDDEEYKDDQIKSSTTDNFYGENSDITLQSDQSNAVLTPVESVLGVGENDKNPETDNSRKHTLEVNEDVDQRNRRVRKRCLSCYSTNRQQFGSREADKASVTPRVNTFCLQCPEKPPMCANCFIKNHK